MPLASASNLAPIHPWFSPSRDRPSDRASWYCQERNARYNGSMIPRILDIPKGNQSFFLFGPRQVGKSTLLRGYLKNQRHVEIDLLETETFRRYVTRPQLLRGEVEHALKGGELTVFIDEIQRVPDLLNEAHLLIERHKDRLRFILSGSSARKLRRSSANMLAGRAWDLRLHPLMHLERSSDFDLNRTLVFGSLPSFIDEEPEAAAAGLRSYVSTYLKQEILDEAIVRNVAVFSHFLELAADQSGDLVNYSTMAREIGVSGKTLNAYYEILEDTLIAFRLEPFLRSARKRLIRHPRYYLFDLGMANALTGSLHPDMVESRERFGRLFEHFVVLEAFRWRSYRSPGLRLYHWRSQHGSEVDLVAQQGSSVVAIEVKSGHDIRPASLTGLRSFKKDCPRARCVCVCTAEHPYEINDVTVLPWRDLFSHEWL